MFDDDETTSESESESSGRLFDGSPDDGAADPDDKQPMIDALLRERDGYIARGLADRVDAVEDALEALGVKREKATKPSGTRRATK